jgi:hypothetical protein
MRSMLVYAFVTTSHLVVLRDPIHRAVKPNLEFQVSNIIYVFRFICFSYNLLQAYC